MKEKRINLIDYYIQSVGVCSMEELCNHFNISISTLRRDINTLLAQNRVQKIYGGVASLTQAQQVIPFENRDIINKKEKSAIAEKAAKFIKSNELIFIDSGTTVRELLKFLPKGVSKLTVLTNNLDVICYIADYRSDISLITLGNFYKSSTRSFVGNDTVHLIDKYNINKAFMAATAVSIENGLTNSDVQEFEIKKKIVSRANTAYLLVDNSKFDSSTLLTYAQLSDVKGIITSKCPPENYVSYCNQYGIELIY